MDPDAEPEEGGRAIVLQVRLTKVFGYGRGETFSATRWRL
jgi:hypothetical protein